VIEVGGQNLRDATPTTPTHQLGRALGDGLDGPGVRCLGESDPITDDDLAGALLQPAAERRADRASIVE